VIVLQPVIAMINMYTQSEIRSHSNKTCLYAPKGAKVTVLFTGIDGICTVEYKGDRFSCPLSKLGDNAPVDEVVINISEGLL